MAASSSSSSDAQGKKYEVFISFRGAEVRSNFLSHLLVALKRKHIKPFVDDTDLERGKEITPTLLKAIEESYVSIVIFSKDYPNSEWCLDELHKILQCMEKKNQIVVPVFYHVDPSVVQDLQQNYALTVHSKVDTRKLANWRNALEEISNLSGFNSEDSQYKPEATLCDEIANDVSNKLSRLTASYPFNDGLFDIDSRIEDVESLIEKEENTISMVGIWGMKGIGKTTLADKVFNKIKNKFDGHCFVWDVKQRSRGKRDKHLRDQIIQELLGDGSVKTSTPHTIDDYIRRRLKDKKVLIVLDDVHDYMQLEYLVIDSGLYSPGMFCRGSRIIVTSKDKQVFENVSMEKHIYEVKQLNDDQARQVFKFHAFDLYSSQEEYEELSMKVVNYAKGLPLALKVLGSELKGKQLKSIPLRSILKILRPSFDELDGDQKRTFLDIACFFKENEVKYVERILECFDFYPINGIDRLCDKSLISISQGGTVQMHDLLQQMGQDTVVEESGQMTEKQSRLWKCEDIEYVLRSDRGTENVEGISLYMREIDGCLTICSKAFINMHKLRFLRVFGFHSFLSSHDDFKKVCLPEGLEFLPSSLRYLHWEDFPLSSLPSNFSLEKLVELHMPYSNLKELVWDKSPRNLKRIYLSFSDDLNKISGLGKAPNLEVIELRDCQRLVEIGSCLEKLSNLTSLNISGCKNLIKLPENLGNLEFLKELDASESGIKELPFSFCKLRFLKILRISKCDNLNKLPGALGNLEFLEEFDASGSGVEDLPASICDLRSLKILKISKCHNLSNLPGDLGNLESLEEFEASGRSLKELPSFICNLRSLKIFRISKCENLNYLPGNLGDLEYLEEFDASASGVEYLPSSICNLRFLKIFKISKCKNLNNLPGDLGNLESLQEFEASESSLKELPSFICNLRYLKIFRISKCENLKYLPGNLGNLKSLKEFDASGSGVEYLPSSICDLRSLKILRISKCKNLNNLPGDLGNLESLEEFEASGSSLKELPSFICNLRSLRIFKISKCENLKYLPGNLGNLECLEEFDVSGSGVEYLPSSICDLRSLKIFKISKCRNLNNLPGDLGNLKSLEEFEASESSLKELPSFICNLRSLKIFRISKCENLNYLPGNLGNLESLEVFDASGSGVEELPYSICDLRSLKILRISNCENLKKLPVDLGNLESLEVFDARGSGLEELPSSIYNLSSLKIHANSDCENLNKISRCI